MPLSLSDLGVIDSIALPPRNSYVMALDCGTTSVRALLIDEYGCVVAQASRPVSTTYPRPGWIEQDPTELLASQIAAMIEVQFKSGIHSASIAAVGITNQRETTVVWDRSTGQPITGAISWQCRRTAPIAEALVTDGYSETIFEKTGLIPDAYFSATKLKWILENVAGAREMADEGRLLFGTVDTWLVFNLTGGAVHATDYTNASRTMLFNIHTLTWDEDLLRMLDIPRSMLPEVRPSSGDFGRVSGEIMTHMPPITGVAGDQQASLFGHCCFERGSAKSTYGTGCFMLINTGDQVVRSSHGLVSTIGIAEGGEVSYALEGSIFQAGSVIEWLRDNLGVIEDPSETSDIARSLPDNGGCYLVPAFTGLGSPWWDSDARGTICGLTRASNRATLVRAACESIAYQAYDVLEAMEADAGIKLSCLSVDGGVSRNDFIMQFQSDLLQIPVERDEVVETTALGAAYLAGLAVGYWESREELVQNRGEGTRYEPSRALDVRARELRGWREAVARSLSQIVK